MPLIKSGSKAAISQNIRTEMANDKPQKQAVAIALDVARRSRAAGGANVAIPWTQRAAASRLSFNGGMIHSMVPGRTDKLNLNVPAGSYVIPSSVVSFLGQDNSAAGANVLNSMFGMGPMGTQRNFRSPQARFQRRGPRYAAEGGAMETEGQTVPVVVAGGEFIVPPDVLMEKFGGDLDYAHKVMDKFVEESRKKHIKTLRKLPGPVKT